MVTLIMSMGTSIMATSMVHGYFNHGYFNHFNHLYTSIVCGYFNHFNRPSNSIVHGYFNHFYHQGTLIVHGYFSHFNQLRHFSSIANSIVHAYFNCLTTSINWGTSHPLLIQLSMPTSIVWLLQSTSITVTGPGLYPVMVRPDLKPFVNCLALGHFFHIYK